MLNLHGNGLFGKVNVVWDSTLIEIEPGYWEYVYNRTDERQYYFKDHPCLAGRRVGSTRLGGGLNKANICVDINNNNIKQNY
jgi:hypothetical protein